MNQLEPCPFCGAPASGHAIEPHTHSIAFNGVKMPDHPGSYVIEGDCACGSGLIGDTQEEVTARWNRRAERDALRADLEMAQRTPLYSTRLNADRYKWLRKNLLWTADGEGQVKWVTWLKMAQPDISAELLEPDSVSKRLDAAIDAARKESSDGQ